MDTNTFYSIVTGTCFTLVGLWWTVVKSRTEWIKNDQMRRLASGVYLSFLVPGLMSLFAQVGGEVKIVWRLTFIMASLGGMILTAQLMVKTEKRLKTGLFGRNRWVVILLYVIILVFASFPSLAQPLGLQALQVEGILLGLLILTAHGLTWEFMTVSTE